MIVNARVVWLGYIARLLSLLNRITGGWDCGILLCVGKGANLIIKQVSPLVDK